MGTSSSLINRRGVLLSGAAAAAALSLPAGAVQPDLAPPSELFALGIEFARLRRRCARQGRHVRQLAAEADRIAASRTKPTARSRRRQRAALDAIREKVGYNVAWAGWSASVDEIAALIDRIFRYRDMPQPIRARHRRQAKLKPFRVCSRMSSNVWSLT